jgi:hypothetical protein
MYCVSALCTRLVGEQRAHAVEEVGHLQRVHGVVMPDAVGPVRGGRLGQVAERGVARGGERRDGRLQGVQEVRAEALERGVGAVVVARPVGAARPRVATRVHLDAAVSSANRSQDVALGAGQRHLRVRDHAAGGAAEEERDGRRRHGNLREPEARAVANHRRDIRPARDCRVHSRLCAAEERKGKAEQQPACPAHLPHLV